ncbi:carbohydrate ABC transporter permease [Pseudolactococcus yaeyamensis]
MTSIKIKGLNKLHLFMLPSLLGVLFFYLLPLLKIFGSSLSNFATKDFVGLTHFQLVLENQAFRLATKNTALFMLVGLPLLMVSSLGFAEVLRKLPLHFQNLKVWYLIPLTIPAASLTLFWQFFFTQSGILNSFFAHQIKWLDSNLGFSVVVIIFMWKNFGFMVILWLGGMMSIPKAMVEAAQIDGATSRDIFWRILLPNLKPTAFVVYLLAIINSFKVYRDIYALAGDYPHQSMYLLQHLFNNWFRDFELDKMAAGTILYLIGLLAIILPAQRKVEKK